jgi:hypothetical protein
MEWRPIWTAPKDGTDVLVSLWNRAGERCAAVAFYQDGEWWMNDPDDAPVFEPTHWMPLPPPPEEP